MNTNPPELTDDERQQLIRNFFADDWAKEAADGLLHDYHRLIIAKLRQGGEPVAWLHEGGSDVWTADKKRNVAEHNGTGGARLAECYNVPLVRYADPRGGEPVADERAALEWYAEQVAGCRKFGPDGEAARHALDRDGGERARAALASAPVATPATDLQLEDLSRQVDRDIHRFGVNVHVGVPAGVLRSMLGTLRAPVAGEAQPVAWITDGFGPTKDPEIAQAWRNLGRDVRPLVYGDAAPQASAYGHKPEPLDTSPGHSAPQAPAGWRWTLHPAGLHPDVYAAAAAHTSDEARNAALEEAAHLMEQTGKRIAASDIRALKSTPAPTAAEGGEDDMLTIAYLAGAQAEKERAALSAQPGVIRNPLITEPSGNPGELERAASEDVALPPVPSAYNDTGSYIGYAKSDLQAYARAAVLADRQQRAALASEEKNDA